MQFDQSNHISSKYLYTTFIWLPLLVWMVLYFGFDFNGLYGQDAHEYLRYSKKLNTWMLTGEEPGGFFWPLAYPMLGAIISIAISKTTLVMQLISLTSIIGAGYFLRKIIRVCYADNNQIQADLFLILFFILSPFLLRSGMVVMSDALCLFLITGFVYHGLKYTQTLSGRHLIVAAFFSASAVMTRYVSVVVMLIILLLVLRQIILQKKWLHLLSGLFVGLFILYPHYFLRSDTSTDFLQHQALQDWKFSNLFSRTLEQGKMTRQNLLPNIVFFFSNFFHPGYLFAGPFLLFFIRQKIFNSYSWIFGLSILCYGLFLSGTGFQNSRFLLLSFPFVILLIYPLFSIVLDFGREQSLRRKFKVKTVFVSLIILVVFIQCSLFTYSMKLFVKMNKQEQLIATSLKQYPGRPLYLFYFDPALKSYEVSNDMINLWSAPIADFEKDALVLFHPTQFSQVWAEHTLMENWHKLNRSESLKTIELYPDGWRLYQIE